MWEKINIPHTKIYLRWTIQLKMKTVTIKLGKKKKEKKPFFLGSFHLKVSPPYHFLLTDYPYFKAELRYNLLHEAFYYHPYGGAPGWLSQ